MKRNKGLRSLLTTNSCTTVVIMAWCYGSFYTAVDGLVINNLDLGVFRSLLISGTLGIAPANEVDVTDARN